MNIFEYFVNKFVYIIFLFTKMNAYT